MFVAQLNTNQEQGRSQINILWTLVLLLVVQVIQSLLGLQLNVSNTQT